MKGVILKPCPFCGGNPHMQENGIGDYYVWCTCCDARSSDVRCESVEHAAERWNRRDKKNAGQDWSDEA